MNYVELVEIVETQFADIINAWVIRSNKLRLFVIDGSYVDIWFSFRLQNRFAYHWERRSIDGSIYRLDNRPHADQTSLPGFPVHFHNGIDSKIERSPFSYEIEKAFIEFLRFMRSKLG